MGPTHVLLKLFMDEADLSEELDTFDERFQLQKNMYLTQVLGFDMRYRFAWYLRGPYSRELTADAFALREQLELGDTDYERFRLTEEARRCVARAREIGQRPKDATCGDAIWLELLASLHYLRHIAYWPSDSTRSFGDVFQSLIRTKPHLAGQKADAGAAWGRLEEVGLIEARTLRAD